MPESAFYPYEVSDTPRSLSTEDLRFYLQYTGEQDEEAARDHITAIWRECKSKVSRTLIFSN